MRRYLYYQLLLAIVVAASIPLGCKRLQETWDAPNPADIQQQSTPLTPVTTEPVVIATAETAVSTPEESATATSEASVSTDEWGQTAALSTEEGSLSTMESETATGEGEMSTEESAMATGEVVYARSAVSIYAAPKSKEKPLEIVSAGTPLFVLPETPVTAEWLLVNDGRKTEGYVQNAVVCPNPFCAEKIRNGIIDLYIQAKIMRVPQIQLKFNNIYADPLRDLKVMAQFFYHDQLIGEDEGFIAIMSAGVLPLAPGKSKIIYLRPYYELPKAEVLSPENPVEVKLYCALESFNYVPCGKFKIDQMLY